MQKIISLFKRDYEGTRQVYDEVVPGAEWVVAGDGIATIKWDGTSCLMRKSILCKRYDAKAGRTPPQGFEPVQDAPDPVTGHWPGWVACQRSNPADRWHFEAYDALEAYFDGTYELCGPKIGNKGSGNPYGFTTHRLIAHGNDILPDAPRTFDALKVYFEENPAYEGIVWHHPDGRMVKIKRRDFGLPWPVSTVPALKAPESTG